MIDGRLSTMASHAYIDGFSLRSFLLQKQIVSVKDGYYKSMDHGRVRITVEWLDDDKTELGCHGDGE